MSKYINEAFKQFTLLEDAEDFELTPTGMDNLGSFMGQAMDDDYTQVIDPEAEDETELKQSYVGKVICDCNVCHSHVFFNKEDIVIDDDDVVNAEEECPYCMSTDGYTIIGEIKAWSPEVEDEIEDELSDEELADEPIEIEDEEETEVVEEGLKLDGVKSLRGTKGLKRRPDKDGVKSLRGRANSKISGTEDLDESLTESIEDVITYSIEFDFEPDDTAQILKLKNQLKKYNLEFVDVDETPSPFIDCEVTFRGKKEDIIKFLSSKYYGWNMEEVQDFYPELFDETLTESIEDVTINTEDETMTMTTKDDGGVVVETSPRETFEEPSFDTEMPNTGDEVIAPLDTETEEDIMGTSDETSEDEMTDEDIPEEDVPVEEFDEETFDELGESYLRKNYDNVNGFSTTKVRVNENLMNIDGVITFKSGNRKKTNFVFEATSKKNGKFLFEGYNPQITNGTKAYKLTCSIANKKIIPESLKYKYSATNALNESVSIRGVVKPLKRR